MGLASGGSLSQASGRITIDTSQAEQAPAKMQGVAAGINQAMGGISNSTNQAQQGISSFARALGVGFGAAGVAQLGKFAIEANNIATAYDRQTVAARNLAGSQENLNDLLAAYDKATGGAIDKASALADVTRLQAVGMADSAAELDRFVTAARGASVAMGKSTQDILGEVQLAVANQSFRRLDQIGLSVTEVKTRMDDLKASTKGMSTEAAFQEAVIGELTRKYGDLAKSAEAQATGVEKARKAWENFRLELGEDSKGITNFMGNALGNWLDQATKDVHSLTVAVQELGQSFGVLPRNFTPAVYNGARNGTPSWMTGVPSSASGPLKPQASIAQQDAMVDWYQRGRDITKQYLSDINDEEAQFGRQRADTIANYNKEIARGAEDYGRQRAQAEQGLQDSIADILQDGARRQIQMAAELSRTIANAQRDSADRLADLQDDLDRTLSERRADSADRIAEMEADRDESIAEKRADSAKRILEIEQNYNEQRERSEAKYHLDKNEAAERLDGRALFDLEARHKLESEQALDSKDKQITDEKAKLDEAVRKVNESYAERINDEKKALDKSIKQANDAHNRQVEDEKEALQKRIDNANEAYGIQLADGIAADNQRIQDLKTAYEAEKLQADTEYGLRLERQAQDHNDQLDAMDDAHDLRITQIGNHAQAERDALDAEFTTTLAALGLHISGYITEQDRIEKAAEKAWDDFMKHVNGTLTTAIGPVENPAIPLPSMNPNPSRTDLQNSINQWMMDQAKTNDPAEKQRLQGLIDDAQGKLNAIAPASVGGTSISASAFAFPAAPLAAASGASNRSLAVSFTPGSIVINAVPGDTAASLADMIDKRILHQVQIAAGRL